MYFLLVRRCEYCLGGFQAMHIGGSFLHVGVDASIAEMFDLDVILAILQGLGPW
jgi:hypothetical protein